MTIPPLSRRLVSVRHYASRLKPFEMACNCLGCGARFQFSQLDHPGFIPPSLLPRLRMREKPSGFYPAIISNHLPSNAEVTHPRQPQAYTRLELERLQRRFGPADDYGDPADLADDTEHSVVFPEKLECEDFVCARCYSLTHYGKGMHMFSPSPSEYSLSEADKILLDQRLGPNSLIVNIVDLIDMPFSFNKNYSSLIGCKHKDMPTILVGNKIDLLPGHGSSTVSQAITCLKGHAKDLNLIDTMMVSAKTGFNMDSLRRAVLQFAGREKQDVFLVGRTNVGKSLVFNSFLSGEAAPRSTVSPAHGTTLGILRKKLANVRQSAGLKIPRHLYLFDLPGFNDALQYDDEYEEMQVKTKISPIKHSLTAKQTGLVGTICRIEVDALVDTAVNFQLYMKISIPYRKQHREAPNDLPGENVLEFRIAPSPDPRSVSCDVVFSGNLGWISFNRPAEQEVVVRIFTPKGISMMIRDPPMRQFSL